MYDLFHSSGQQLPTNTTNKHIHTSKELEKDECSYDATSTDQDGIHLTLINILSFMFFSKLDSFAEYVPYPII